MEQVTDSPFSKGPSREESKSRNLWGQLTEPCAFWPKAGNDAEFTVTPKSRAAKRRKGKKKGPRSKTTGPGPGTALDAANHCPKGGPGLTPGIRPLLLRL